MLGVRTVIYPVSDLSGAARWYSEVFNVTPYFQQPFYVGFQIAGFELGLVPDGEPSTKGQVTYWGTLDIVAEYERILQLGAERIEPPTDVGEGIFVATLADPFGNVLGLIENPHFDATKVA